MQFVKQNYKIYIHVFYFISNPRQNCRGFQYYLDVSVKLVYSLKSVDFFGKKSNLNSNGKGIHSQIR